MERNVGHERLAKNEWRKNEEVNAVNGAIDDQVACDAEKNQQIHACIEQIGWQDTLGKAAETCGREGASSDQHQTPVQLRFFAPIYGQRKRTGEANHVKERNDKVGLRIRHVETHRIETSHDDSGRDPDDRNQRA